MIRTRAQLAATSRPRQCPQPLLTLRPSAAVVITQTNCVAAALDRTTDDSTALTCTESATGDCAAVVCTELTSP